MTAYTAIEVNCQVQREHTFLMPFQMLHLSIYILSSRMCCRY